MQELLDNYLLWSRHMIAPHTSEWDFSEAYRLGDAYPAERSILAYWTASLEVAGDGHAEVREN
jgi:hypothetical protein